MRTERRGVAFAGGKAARPKKRRRKTGGGSTVLPSGHSPRSYRWAQSDAPIRACGHLLERLEEGWHSLRARADAGGRGSRHRILIVCPANLDAGPSGGLIALSSKLRRMRCRSSPFQWPHTGVPGACVPQDARSRAWRARAGLSGPILDALPEGGQNLRPRVRDAVLEVLVHVRGRVGGRSGVRQPPRATPLRRQRGPDLTPRIALLDRPRRRGGWRSCTGGRPRSPCPHRPGLRSRGP